MFITKIYNNLILSYKNKNKTQEFCSNSSDIQQNELPIGIFILSHSNYIS